jgi:hypothetical protein
VRLPYTKVMHPHIIYIIMITRRSKWNRSLDEEVRTYVERIATCFDTKGVPVYYPTALYDNVRQGSDRDRAGKPAVSLIVPSFDTTHAAAPFGRS